MLTRIGGRLGGGRGRRGVAHPHRQQERMRLAQQAPAHGGVDAAAVHGRHVLRRQRQPEGQGEAGRQVGEAGDGDAAHGSPQGRLPQHAGAQLVDGGGDLINALIGELILRYAQSKGVVGFVVNGAARDIDFVQSGNYPVYAAGVTHRGPYKDGPGTVNGPISIDGMPISPGDIIIGDMDGVVSIPRLMANSVLENSLVQMEREKNILAAIAAASWDRSWVDETLRSRGCVGV